MSIKLKSLTLKNFLSIGQVTQAVDFDKPDLTLILGENLDLGGDGARNGTGKTTLIQGLSYALFGVAINNIRKDNLINRTNGKGMLITLDFEVNGVDYRIVRGRKPNILKFYANSQELVAQDDAQGDSRETQDHIERVLNMGADMFRNVVALNTYSEPFLAMKANDQRAIIEQLLGITLLSEKAEVIKELVKTTKDNIVAEEARLKAVQDANQRIQEQIDSLVRRQNMWAKKRDEDIAGYTQELETLNKIDIDSEIINHRLLAEFYSRQERIAAASQRALDAQTRLETKLAAGQRIKLAQSKKLKSDLAKYEGLDYETEVTIHREIADYRERKADWDLAADLRKNTATVAAQLAVDRDRMAAEVAVLREHKCYACGQDYHDDSHAKQLSGRELLLEELVDKCLEAHIRAEEAAAVYDALSTPQAPRIATTKNLEEALNLRNTVDNLRTQLNTVTQALDDELDTFNREQEELLAVCEAELAAIGALGAAPRVFYDDIDQALGHRTRVDTIFRDLVNRQQDTDPYAEQITEMREQALGEVSFDHMNYLTRLRDHQEFLLKLLTSKDSFVRKKIIEQNLSYLNARLTHYLDKMGLPHQVVFQNDLSVEITELGRDLDFDNLSRGERTRLILGLSFAFRDVWESLYSPVNILFIDELIDNGLDTQGVENSIAILKDMSRRRNKSIWLVSHRDELTNRVESVLRVVKEGGYTSYSTSTEFSHTESVA